MVLADLNLYCVYQNYNHLWLDFADQFDQKCTDFIQDCANEVMSSIKIDSKLIK